MEQSWKANVLKNVVDCLYGFLYIHNVRTLIVFSRAKPQTIDIWYSSGTRACMHR